MYNIYSRFGFIGEKIGMTTIVDGKSVIGVTLVKIYKQNVLDKKQVDDFFILKVGVEFGKLRKKPQIDELRKKDLPLCKVVREFKILKDEVLDVGSSYEVDAFENDKFVDIRSKNIGKGFAGGMKRWNFSGAPASHGASLSHRAIGSTGTRDKNWRGKKMPGRLGGEYVTVQNLKISYIDRELGILALHGSVPGKVGSIVLVKRALKKQGAGRNEC